MSDYLTDLAARTLQRAAVVQPRLASRFEPTSAAQSGGWLAGHAFAGHAFETEAAEERESDPMAAATSWATPMAAPMATPHDGLAMPGRRLDSSVVEATGQGPSLSTNSASNSSEAHLRQAASGFASGVSAAPAAAPLVTRPTVAQPLTAPGAPRPAMAPVEPSRLAERGLAAFPTVVVAQPHVTLRPASEAATPVPATPPPAPTIRVTIGRIEVRAIPPPATPAPRARPPQPNPAPSLEDYLKQRNGGRR